MKMKTQLKQLYEKKHNIELAHIQPNESHEVGSTYFNGYWKEIYTVTDIKSNGVITVLWSDNRSTTHSTKLDHLKDFKVITNKELN